MAVTAEPAIVVPAVASSSGCCGATHGKPEQEAAVPGIACASANSVTPPPAGWTLYMILAGATSTYADAVYGATFAHVAAAGTVPPWTYCLTSIAAFVALTTRSATCAPGSATTSSRKSRRILSAPAERPLPHNHAV